MAMRILVLLIVCSLISCSSSDSNSESDGQLTWVPQASNEWPVSTPESAGFDHDAFVAAFDQGSKTNGLESMCVVRNDALIGESYFSGISQSSVRHVRSVTKTVTALLVGIALEQGFLRDLDQAIGPFFAELVPDLAPEKSSLTIRHLLTMTSGFEWDESTATGYTSWANSSDPIRYVLDRPLTHDPGTTFTYNSGAVHLLSVVLTDATGQGIRPFAETNLFGPLGIDSFRWETLADGRHNGAAGLELRPRDMAKLGKMLLHLGRWDDQQIVPQEWVQQMKTRTRDSHGSYAAFDNIDYGFLWWLGSGSGDDMELAWGWGGQFIATFPSLDLIVVTTSRWSVDGNTANGQEEANINLIINRVLQAIR